MIPPLPADSGNLPKRKRGRPSRTDAAQLDVRRTLLRAGMEVLTESPFSTSSLDTILKRAGVPKGSFYHYFASKEAFGLAVLEQYDSFFARLLHRTLLDDSVPPLDRPAAFVNAAARGMEKYAFRRGCAVGNLSLEVTSLPQAWRQQLQHIFSRWEWQLASCLQAAIAAGQLAAQADSRQLAACFWIGWEGAVLRARLSESREPLDLFLAGFMAGLPRP